MSIGKSIKVDSRIVYNINIINEETCEDIVINKKITIQSIPKVNEYIINNNILYQVVSITYDFDNEEVNMLVKEKKVRVIELQERTK